MSLHSDHKALVFLAAVAVLGAGVRVVRAAGRGEAPVVQPALDRQRQSVDSAASAGRAGKSAKGRSKLKSRSGSAAGGDTVRRRSRRDTTPATPPSPDRPGYVRGRLDLDIATAAQLDSLPGVTPAMARRIVADRMTRGPFLNRDGLRRVQGVGPAFLAKIDSSITFSGTYARPEPSDTVIPPRRGTRAKPKPPMRPAVLRRAGPRRARWLREAADTRSPGRGSAGSPPRAT